MHIESVALTNFKNYTQEILDFNPGINILTGLNGMGKTNVLEAIHFICLGKGYFTYQDKMAITSEQDFFRLEGKILIDNDRYTHIVVKLKEGGKKEIEIDGVSLPKLSDHLGKIPCVMFAPEDVQLLLETSEARRNFLNQTLVQYDMEYLNAILLYNNLLKSRNAYLKQMTTLKAYNDLYLESLHEKMEQPARLIYEKRKFLVEELNKIFEEIYSWISGKKEKCQISYQSQLDSNDPLSLWKDSMDLDKILGRTSKGIHKDDIELWMDEKPIKHFGSQGQLKSFVLALKIAQFKILEKIRDIKPLIMLDDVFDKLDERRVGHLMALLSGDNFGQVIITDTDENRVPDILDAMKLKGKHFFVESGKIIKTWEHGKTQG